MADQALATAMHVMQVTMASKLGSTPGALAFSRDMFLNVLLIANGQTIAQRLEHYLNDNLCHADRKQHQYDYAPGQKLLRRWLSCYNIEQAHVKIMITIESHPGITE